MYAEVLKEVGLSPNEAQIYETLLERGELTVPEIATRANIHRRNAYDAINRLAEKGFVLPVLGRGDNRYTAVDPVKLREILNEKQQRLDLVLPEMQKLFKHHRTDESTYIYKGIEGYKNFLGDMLQVGDDVYTIGAKGAWTDQRLLQYSESFWLEAKRKGMKFYTVFDESAKDYARGLSKYKNVTSRILAPQYSSNSAIDIYGNRVVMQRAGQHGVLPEDITLFMLVSRDLAESYRTWFKLIWAAAKK